MNPLSLIKSVSEIVVSIGVGAVVGNAIKASTPSTVTTLQKVMIGVGGFVLSGMVGDMATKYTSDSIDGTVDKIKQMRNPNPEEVTEFYEMDWFEETE